MGCYMRADVDDNLIKRSIPAHSDARLDDAIARLEANAATRGCDELLQFARTEKSRRQAGKPSTTAFSRTPARPKTPTSIQATERNPKPAPARAAEELSTKPEDPRIVEAQLLARKAQDLVFEAHARGETLLVDDAVRLVKLEAAHGASSVEIVARKAREKVQLYEATGKRLDLCDAVRMVREGR